MKQHSLRRLTYTLCLLLVWLSFVVEGSHALLSDSVTLAGNTITTGSATLEVSNSQAATPDVFANSRPGFTISLSPGGTDTKYFFLRNSSIAVIPLDIGFMPSVPDPSLALVAAVTLEVTPVDDGGNAIGTPVTGTMATLYGHLNQLQVSIPQGATQRYKLKSSLDQTFAKANQSLTFDLNVTGTQHYAP